MLFFCVQPTPIGPMATETPLQTSNREKAPQTKNQVQNIVISVLVLTQLVKKQISVYPQALTFKLSV